MQEVEWEEIKYVPTVDEYLNNAYVSFSLGPILQIPLPCGAQDLGRDGQPSRVPSPLQIDEHVRSPSTSVATT